jgi:hypothetical protein
MSSTEMAIQFNKPNLKIKALIVEKEIHLLVIMGKTLLITL